MYTKGEKAEIRKDKAIEKKIVRLRLRTHPLIERKHHIEAKLYAIENEIRMLRASMR